MLTQYQGSILGPIAKVLGFVMNGIYSFMSGLGINNIGLSIIILTVIIYTCLLPLTYKQQKFSYISRVMNPELKAIQEKYKGKKDNDSMLAQNEETRALYDKYGVSASGSCVQLLIQMPILFALYRVFNNVPAYVENVKNMIMPLSEAVMKVDGYRDSMTSIVDSLNLKATVGADFTIEDTTAISNYIVDVIYKFTNEGWQLFRDTFSTIDPSVINKVSDDIGQVNYFLGLNIGYSPFITIMTSFNEHNYLVMVGAVMIPLVSYLTQMLNIKLMPQAENAGNDQMAQQMKTMNMVMPLFSLFMCFTVPVGLGIYWIASALVRVIQQLSFNKYFESIDIDAIIEKNKEKAKAKAKKRANYAQIYNSAKTSTKTNTNISGKLEASEQDEKLKNAREYTSKAKPGSMAARANMVKEFNERNTK